MSPSTFKTVHFSSLIRLQVVFKGSFVFFFLFIYFGYFFKKP